MPQKKAQKESQLDVIARHVADMHRNMLTKEDAKSFATKEDIKNFATKTDIAELRLEMNERFDDVASKDDLHDLETKLIEDTGIITGVEKKHYDSLTQRVIKLEEKVFST